jgi:hypothetical protein
MKLNKWEVFSDLFIKQKKQKKLYIFLYRKLIISFRQFYDFFYLFINYIKTFFYIRILKNWNKRNFKKSTSLKRLYLQRFLNLL